MRLRKTSWALLIGAVSISLGCSESPTEVSAEELTELTQQWKEPKVAIWYYEGTDEEFHYFKFVDVDGTRFFKVRKSEMDIENPVLTTEKTGSIRRVMPWGPLPRKTHDDAREQSGEE